jgi:ribosome-associated protein
VIVITDKIQVPRDELKLQYVRSGGPGGQNVNKVATKAVLHWDVTRSPSLPAGVKARFLERHATRINAAGELVISSGRFRSQARNAEACIDLLRELVAEVVSPPAERVPTGTPARARRRRLEDKRRHATAKRQRRQVGSDED